MNDPTTVSPPEETLHPPHIAQVPGDQGLVLAQAAATAPTAVQAAAAVQEMVGNQLPILQQAEQEALSPHPPFLLSFTWVVAVLTIVTAGGWLLYQAIALHNTSAMTVLVGGSSVILALFKTPPTVPGK